MKSIVALLVALVGVASACDFPPSLWCSSKEIAKRCQVEEHCAKYNSAAAAPVRLALYYESLCPDCKQFFKHQLVETFHTIGSIMNLTLVPYGNAMERKVGDHYVFTCQHGKEECEGNVIETCAIHLLKDITVFFPFISCVEALQSNPRSAAKVCARLRNISQIDAILACADGRQGNQLEHKMAVKTENLHPDHQYVPWVTLNGVHTEDIQNQAEKNLIKLICDTYKGPKPAGCQAEKPKKRCEKRTWSRGGRLFFGQKKHEVL